MNQNLTVSVDTVSESPANSELHSPTEYSLKREKYDIAASDKWRGRAQIHRSKFFNSGGIFIQSRLQCW